MKRILFLLLILLNILMGIDLTLEEKSTSIQTSSSRQYFGKNLFQGAFKENKQLR